MGAFSIFVFFRFTLLPVMRLYARQSESGTDREGCKLARGTTEVTDVACGVMQVVSQGDVWAQRWDSAQWELIARKEVTAKLWGREIFLFKVTADAAHGLRSGGQNAVLRHL